MDHQIIGTAWSGAVATVTVEALLLVGTLVSSRVMPARMMSEIPALLFFTSSKVEIPFKVPNNFNVSSRSHED